MTKQVAHFWDFFNQKLFSQAQSTFDTLSDHEKQNVLSELFQKGAFARSPAVISVLYRELDDKKTFDDFHRAWFPPKEYLHKIKQDGEIYQQLFPAPTRVYNAVNMENPKEVLSVGFTWIDSKKQEEEMMAYMQLAGQDKVNQKRSDNIDTVARKISSKLYELKASDNLGVPFDVFK